MKSDEGTLLVVSNETIEQLTNEVGSLRKEIAELHSGSNNGAFPYAPIPGLCKELGISRPFIYALKRKGLLNLYKLGSRSFVLREELEKAIQNGKV